MTITDSTFTALDGPLTTQDVVVPSATDWHLHNALKATLLAASTDRTLPVLRAVQITREGNTLTLTSTDRYRCQIVKVPLHAPEPTPGDWAIIVDRDDVTRLLKLLPKHAARGVPLPVTLTYGEPEAGSQGGTLTVRTFDSTVTITGVDGDYPRIRSLVPSEASFADTDSWQCNPGFLADLCKMPGRERNAPVRLQFSGPNKPVLSTWTDSYADDVEYTHFLMPVRQAR